MGSSAPTLRPSTDRLFNHPASGDTSHDVPLAPAAVDAAAAGSKLRRMARFRLCLVVVVIVVVACERARTPASGDSNRVKIGVARDSAPPAVAARDWDPSAGPVLLVAAETPARAYVVLPEAASAATELAGIPRHALVTLFGRGGTVQTAEMPQVSDTGACIAAALNAAPPPRPWNVGFIGGVVSPLGMDSIESFSHDDSVATVAGITRLASSLPNDTAGRFSGLPFVVHAVWRFTILNGPQIVAATLSRQINQEATPLREQTLVIAERSRADSALTMDYSERSYGNEETVESHDVLAAALLGATHTPALVISRDYGDAIAYGLVERGPDRRWRARWSSARRHCSH